MKKSWFEWFIEDLGRYNRVLVVLFYLYPIFVILTFPFVAPVFIGCVLSLIIDSIEIPTLKAIIIIVMTIAMYAFGCVIQWFWNRRKLVEK